ARRVTMLIRGVDLRPSMSHYLADRIRGTANITVIPRTELTAVCGEGHLERVEYRNRDTNEADALASAALFIFIGTAPGTDVFKQFLLTDDKGFIVTGPDLRAAGH